MKLLIAGRNSYIGCHIGEFVCAQEPDSEVTYISVRNDDWKAMDLSGFDAVVFAAAIVHRKDITDESLYNRVNAQLPYDLAQKAKAEGVKRFLFLSTAGVYKSNKTIPASIITADTPLEPDGPYGKSKLEGERLLKTLADDNFLLSIVRPMNVYGRGCPGNYIPIFMKITRLLPVIPKAFTDVKQGMVHVDHLAKLCYLALRAEHGGVYHAQDRRAVSSFEIMQAMAQGMGQRKKVFPCHGAVRMFNQLAPVVKLYGAVAYSNALAACPLGEYADEDPVQMLKETVRK